MTQMNLALKINHACKDVPWIRQGNPSLAENEYNRSKHPGTKWKSRIANAGGYRSRIYSDEKILELVRQKPEFGPMIFGIEERAFAIMWDYENNGSYSCGIMDHILSDEFISKFIKRAEDRYLAEIVAQAVVQWLGTNCGRSFVDQARAKAEVDYQRLKRQCSNICDQSMISKIIKNKEETLIEKESEIRRKEQELLQLKSEYNAFRREWVDGFDEKMEEVLEKKRLESLSKAR